MHSGRDSTRRLQSFARKMRREQTDAEKRIWSILRNGRLGGHKFRRQVPVAGYIVDFYCIEKRIVVELDGGQHGEPDQIHYDRRRTQVLEALGITVLRFWDPEVLKHGQGVARTILSHLEASERPSPQPSPGVPGEGVKASAPAAEI